MNGFISFLWFNLGLLFSEICSILCIPMIPMLVYKLVPAKHTYKRAYRCIFIIFLGPLFLLIIFIEKLFSPVSYSLVFSAYFIFIRVGEYRQPSEKDDDRLESVYKVIAESNEQFWTHITLENHWKLYLYLPFYVG
eukprot:UN27531